MSRPRLATEDTVSTAVRLPESLHARLVESAAERELSANYLVRRAVEQFLDRLIPVDEIKWTRDPE